MSIGNMGVSSENVKIFKISLRSPIPCCISSWKREGIQLKEEDQKNGSMLYLVAFSINKGCAIRESKCLLCAKHLQYRSRHVLNEHCSNASVLGPLCNKIRCA